MSEIASSQLTSEGESQEVPKPVTVHMQKSLKKQVSSGFDAEATLKESSQSVQGQPPVIAAATSQPSRQPSSQPSAQELVPLLSSSRQDVPITSAQKTGSSQKAEEFDADQTLVCDEAPKDEQENGDDDIVPVNLGKHQPNADIVDAATRPSEKSRSKASPKRAAKSSAAARSKINAKKQQEATTPIQKRKSEPISELRLFKFVIHE